MSSVLESSLLLRQCGDSRDLARGREIHRQLVQSGEDRQTFLGNLIILMYGKCGRTEDAIQAFHRIRHSNIYSWTNLISAFVRSGDLDRARSALHSMPAIEIVAWNTIITAYAQQGHPRRALHLFEIMDLEGIVGDGITLLGAIEACAQLQSLSRGRQIHARIVSLGLDRSELPLANSLIKMYSRCASVRDAKRVFDGMIHRDLVSWNTIIAALATNGHFDLALEAFNRMNQRDRASWNTMIVAFSQLGDHRRSMEFLASMDLEGIEPDEITFLGGLEACAGLTAIAEGKLLHSSIQRWGLDSRLQISTSLITMYGKCGDPELARSIFDNCNSRDLIFWNAMLAAYAKNGHLVQALDLFWQMDLEGIAKSAATHVNLLAGLSHGGTLRDGIEFFLAMSADHSVEPGYKHYSCVIDLLARTGKLGDAHDLLLAMPFYPDVISWTTLLTACKLHKDSNRAAAIAREIGSSQNVVVSIANFYVQDT
ncbi:pentatricopeptide repeat-containing protein At2g21090-like [Selaginella moellendorffii]|nr:pentatricopeptide repeat-containing protein At2g21090-like [Selaginella moellendorffii]|eukprot:XP_024517968.1 pentatricopeptide repeat-containing protein At2g21090-like [Selaginella moellendorffii]